MRSFVHWTYWNFDLFYFYLMIFDLLFGFLPLGFSISLIRSLEFKPLLFHPFVHSAVYNLGLFGFLFRVQLNGSSSRSFLCPFSRFLRFGTFSFCFATIFKISTFVDQKIQTLGICFFFAFGLFWSVLFRPFRFRLIVDMQEKERFMDLSSLIRPFWFWSYGFQPSVRIFSHL